MAPQALQDEYTGRQALFLEFERLDVRRNPACVLFFAAFARSQLSRHHHSLGFRRHEFVSVQLEKHIRRSKSNALVAVDERMIAAQSDRVCSRKLSECWRAVCE